MECKFSKSRNKYEGALRLDGLEISKSESFRYVGSIIQKYGEFEYDVNHMIRVGWWSGELHQEHCVVVKYLWGSDDWGIPAED